MSYDAPGPYQPRNNPHEIVHIPFHGRVIHTALSADGEPVVILKPTVEEIGLDFSAQLEKLKTRSWAVVTETLISGADGKIYPMVSVNLETWSMLLANVDENKVILAARPIVIAYQRESAKALRDYWTRGVAANPRYSPREKAEMLAALKGIVDSGFLEAKGRQLVGRTLGEVPEFDEQTKPLTVAMYLNSLGLKSSAIRRVQSQFGKQLKARYRDQYGCEPPQMEDLVNRHMIKVAQYQEQHRPLFDAVWRSMNRDDGGTTRPKNRPDKNRPK
ncbi:phage antirepressor N-terminal domain-containing protein [Stackebrandtia nassauensis]|uniref:Antirepressor protein ant N-terminal domain-containing protein n=1 Tax=Stackebrandtia nassauensis (strain DSM 44728 / CIP 108903 / NRRL B-16338 / NBRC 102104 / LLR-40K-21) TaxID=446470 RepID=D3PV11_STANL|nr:phage antirepressor N-terminal domain-containing protein [Stackebrandtia nassauensis]ADD45035.1 hypothetical protein Snas_5403 [Stackebrandtia nassauensis DSM 44728]